MVKVMPLHWAVLFALSTCLSQIQGFRITDNDLQDLSESDEEGMDMSYNDYAKMSRQFGNELQSSELTGSELDDEVSELDERHLRDQRPQGCPSSYSYNAHVNLCWRVENQATASWFKAWWHCATEGGHLIILDSAAKVAYIQFTLTLAGAEGRYWVGGEDVTDEGKFSWINGEKVNSLPWNYGQPNNGNRNEHCLAMMDSKHFDFFDAACSAKYHFICEISLGSQ